MSELTRDLAREDCQLILESLRYTRQAFEQYEHYPSAALRRQRLADVDAVITRVRAVRDGLPK